MREIELTSYAELVLAPQAADVAHPAFSKLFVETEYLADDRRDPGDAAAALAERARDLGRASRGRRRRRAWASRRSKPTGRASSAAARSVRTPIAVIDGRPLSNTVGTVLDPDLRLRRRVRIAPGATVRVAFWTLVASSRERRARPRRQASRHHRLRARGHAGLDPGAGAASPSRHRPGRSGPVPASRRPPALCRLRRCGRRRTRSGAAPAAQSALWPHGISGDLPIVLVRIDDVEDLDIVRQLLQAHEYWRMKQLAVDLVILNERASSYVQDLQIALETLVRTSQSRPQVGAERRRGRVFVLRADLIPAETRALLSRWRGPCWSAARAPCRAARPRAGVDRSCRDPSRRESPLGCRAGSAAPSPPDLEFFNGLGGFADGRTGVRDDPRPGPVDAGALDQRRRQSRPSAFRSAPKAAAITWSVNSRENQLTPWSNDPVTDRPGEAIYLRDEDTGELWSPTALPIRDDAATYVARHGRGYSRFEHTAHGIALDLLQYVPLDDPIKISRLTLRNTSGRTRRLSVTAYVEWVLGAVARQPRRRSS